MAQFKKKEEYSPAAVAEVIVPSTSLAFRVVAAGDGLYSAQMLLLHGDTVAEKKTGVATTLGHAIAGADEAMDGWAFSEIETKAVDYFNMVIL